MKRALPCFVVAGFVFAAGADEPIPVSLNGDAFGDNVVDLLDVNAVLLRFGLPWNGPEDLNGSGFVDVFDLNVVLLNVGLAGDDLPSGRRLSICLFSQSE